MIPRPLPPSSFLPFFFLSSFSIRKNEKYGIEKNQIAINVYYYNVLTWEPFKVSDRWSSAVIPQNKLGCGAQQYEDELSCAQVMSRHADFVQNPIIIKSYDAAAAAAATPPSKSFIFTVEAKEEEKKQFWHYNRKREEEDDDEG